VVLFPTAQFAIFFTVALALSWALMPRPSSWKPFIVVASYAFYAAANWRFCFLLGGITLWNQAASRLLERTEDERRRKRIIAVTVAGDLAVLGVLKYY
jgi:D-alanyl-lipoteichoic acid acyltransferase DltB (MBOAT superfamily)